MTQRFVPTALSLVMAAAAVSGAAGTASAASPHRSTVHVEDTFVSRTTEDCGFNILLHIEGTITVTEFADQAGTVIRALVTYPALFFTFSNEATGESVTSRSPDPEHYRWGTDGTLTLTVTGLVMHLVVPGEGVLAAQAGRFVITIDPNGNETVSEQVGRNDEYHAALCEILAP